MRCLLPLIVLLGAARAVPFFRIDFPEHRSDPEAGPEVLTDEAPGDPDAVFAFQLPKIDLSAIFKPLRVFAGVNVGHTPAIAERVEPNCDQEKFDMTDQEFDVVMDCQKLFAGSDVELKECILTKLPKTSVELRAFLDRVEFGVASISSSFDLALVDGEFTQKRSVQFRLCPRDEFNSIDAVEEIVPVEVVGPDRVDVPEPEVVIPVSAPEAVVPPSRPVFKFPPIRLPDFGQIFSQAFAPVFRPAAPESGGQSGLGLFGSSLNPFAVHRPESVPEAQPEGQEGFFGALFPQLAAAAPERTDVDMSDCASKKFNVSRFVFNVANRCQYANDYRKCLSMDLVDNEDAKDLLEFAVSPDYSVVASSFSSYQASINFKATRKNEIDLKRCANVEVVQEEEVSEAPAVNPEEVSTASEPVPEATQDTPTVSEIVPEEVPLAPEEYPEQPASAAEVIPEVFPETPVVVVDSAPETPELAPETPELAPETPELAPETPELAPETPELVPETPKLVPETPELAPETPEYAPEAPTKLSAEAEKAVTKLENPAEETKALEP